MSSLGQKIKQLRKNKGIKQGELADGLVTPSMISQIEADKAQPSRKVLDEIAKRLDTPVEYFLTDLHVKQEQSLLLRRARQRMEQEDFAGAIQILRELLAQEEFGSQHQIAMDLADCLLSIHDYEKAKELYLRLYEKGIQNANYHIASLALNKLGVIHHAESNYVVANWYWEKSLALVERSEGIPLELHAQIYINLGIVSFRLGMYAKSEAFYSHAYRMLEHTNQLRQIADTCLGLGLAHSMLSQMHMAIHYGEQAVDLYRRLGMYVEELQARVNVAILKRDNFEFEGCLSILTECIDVYSIQKNWNDRANIMAELARTHVLYASHKQNKHEQLLEYDKAEEICKDALLYCNTSSLLYADLSMILADISRSRAQYAEAARHYKQAIRLFAEYQLIPQLLQACTSLANMQTDLGQHDFAVETYIQMEKMIHNIVK